MTANIAYMVYVNVEKGSRTGQVTNAEKYAPV